MSVMRVSYVQDEDVFTWLESSHKCTIHISLNDEELANTQGAERGTLLFEKRVEAIVI